MLKRKKIIILSITLILITSMLGCENNQARAVNATRTITDMAGRTLTIPETVTKVYSTNPIGTILMYTLAPNKLAGLNWSITPGEKKYTTEQYQQLPVLGGWFGNSNTGNPEEILNAQPDIVISIGDINETTISTAEKRQSQLGVPVLLLDGKLEELNKCYELIGKLIGEEDRARELSDYCSKTNSDIQKKVAKIPREQRIRVYYAEGFDGLQTDPQGSRHAEVLEYAGGINVADVPIKQGCYGRSEVSMEQVMLWNPDLIIVCFDQGFSSGGSSYNTILSDEKWNELKAVKNKKVYEIPAAPFNWFDRPPSVNRLIGLKWLANLLYPDIVSMDIKAEVKDFYKTFYHCSLSDEDIKELLERAKVSDLE